MYRHFAVTTLAVTLVTALAADNKTRDEAQAKMVAMETRTLEKREEMQQTYGQAKLVNNAVVRQTGSGWGGDDGFSGSYGSPMDSVGAQVENIGGGIAAAQGSLGLPQSVLDQMSEAERAEMLRRLEEERARTNPRERRRQAENLLNRSRSRSGNASADIDI